MLPRHYDLPEISSPAVGPRNYLIDHHRPFPVPGHAILSLRDVFTFLCSFPVQSLCIPPLIGFTMTYPLFHQIPEDLRGKADIKPDFYDTDGSPVYGDSQGWLIGHIVSKNDVATLKLYSGSPITKVFRQSYEDLFWHPLFVAERSGSVDALRLLLEIYLADPTYTEPLDHYLKRLCFSPINVACAAAHQELTQWLLHHALPQATLYGRNIRGETPLFSAASGLTGEHKGLPSNDAASSPRMMNKHEEFICFLLGQGCSVKDSNIYVKESEDNADSSYQTAELEGSVLGAAIPNAGYKMVSRLIAEGAEVHARQRWLDPIESFQKCKGVTALHIASLFWNLEGIYALMDHHGDLSVAEMVSHADEHGRLPLHWALLGYYKSTGQNDENEISSRMMSTLRLLLEANPETVNARTQQGATVFNYAVQSDTGAANIIAIVNLLLDAKPHASTFSYNTPGSRTALQDAVDNHARRGGNLRDGQLMQLLKILLAKGVDTRLSLHRLCDGIWMESIDTNLIDRLLEGADINDTDGDGCTAMHYLVRRMDQINATRYLIKLGADVNVINHKGNTPLHEVMKGTMLRRIGEDGMFDRSQPQDSPYKAREELIAILVNAGGLIDQPNSAGHTPAQLLGEIRERKRQAEAGRPSQRGSWRGSRRGCRHG